MRRKSNGRRRGRRWKKHCWGGISWRLNACGPVVQLDAVLCSKVFLDVHHSFLLYTVLVIFHYIHYIIYFISSDVYRVWQAEQAELLERAEEAKLEASGFHVVFVGWFTSTFVGCLVFVGRSID